MKKYVLRPHFGIYEYKSYFFIFLMSVEFGILKTLKFSMYFGNNFFWFIFIILVFEEIKSDDDDYNILRKDGSYDFGYNNPDSYHYAQANRNNVVRGEFGGRDPKTGGIDTTHYTAGPRGYRPRGKNIVRKYDLSQTGPRAVGSPDDPYYDPYEDPSYNFSFRTRTYNRDENANRVGDVNGRYSYIDDVGERHNVEFIAGKNTGFHVKTPFPDSNPRAYGPLYFRGRGKPIPRGRTSIQRGLDGSYKFVSAGPDQRRTETSDATGHVRGSYTYLDDKGVQHSVHYIAGPETGYRVLKNVKGPHLPTVFPFQHPDIIPPDFYTEPDIFDKAATGHGRPRPSSKPGYKDEDNGLGEGDDDFGSKPKPKPKPGSTRPPYGGDTNVGSRPPQPSFEENESGYDTDFGDLFGGSTGNKGGSITPNKPDTSKESGSSESVEDGLYKPPKNNLYIPPEAMKPTGGSSEEDYGFDKSSTPRPPPNRGTRPPINSDGNEDFGGLFGSESNRPKPAYGGASRPTITIGGTNNNCPKCEGTIVTNIGDTYLSVPPGVSVRAHVQAVDLSPYSSRFPPPSEQYKADISLNTEQLNAAKDKIVSGKDGKLNEDYVKLKTEQLNAAKDKIVSKKDDADKDTIVNRNKDEDKNIEEVTEESTTEEVTTEIVPTTFSPKNTTKKQ